MNDQILDGLAELAERHISVAMAAQTVSQSPSVNGVAGEINMAWKLGMITFERRDVLLCQLRQIVNHRRSQLCKQKNARIIGGVQ